MSFIDKYAMILRFWYHALVHCVPNKTNKLRGILSRVSRSWRVNFVTNEHVVTPAVKRSNVHISKAATLIDLIANLVCQ